MLTSADAGPTPNRANAVTENIAATASTFKDSSSQAAGARRWFLLNSESSAKESVEAPARVEALIEQAFAEVDWDQTLYLTESNGEHYDSLENIADDIADAWRQDHELQVTLD